MNCSSGDANFLSMLELATTQLLNVLWEQSLSQALSISIPSFSPVPQRQSIASGPEARQLSTSYVVMLYTDFRKSGSGIEHDMVLDVFGCRLPRDVGVVEPHHVDMRVRGGSGGISRFMVKRS